MRIGLDGTPLLGQRTGIGRYVHELLQELPRQLDQDDDLRVTAFTLRGRRPLAALVPAGVGLRHRPAPARVLHETWARAEIPRVGMLAGRVEVFHGTNFVLPPVGRAGGVVTVHDLAYLRHPELVSAASRRYVDLVPRSVRRAAAVCVPSASVAGELADAYPAAEGKVTVTPLGVSSRWTDADQRPEEAGPRAEPPYLLFVGSVEPRKGLPTVLAALRLLHARGRRDLPRLCLAGPAGWGAELDTRGLPEGLVVRTGHLPDDDLLRLVAGASALLYPSRYEGFGLPVLEAFALGTPVIASDIPTTVELVGCDGRLADLFPVGDAEALAALIEKATTATGDAAARGRRRALARSFSWERTAALTAEAYRRAAERV